jgi:UDP-glucose 4-epimerase
MTRTALVTGGAGFIGSHVVDRLLADGWAVLVVDDLSTGRIPNLELARTRRDFAFHQADIRSPDLRTLVERYRPDTICHLAAQASVSMSVREPVRDAEINILGTINLLEAARQAGTRRVVFASSGGAIYGSAARLPAREDRVKRPDSPYGISKKVVADYFDWYRRTYGLEYVLEGFTNVYGPRQSPHGEAGVVSIFAEAMLSGRPPTIFGDGRQTRDFVFVTDVADAVVRGAEAGDGKLLNIGTGVETSVNQIAALLVELTGSKVRPGYGPDRPGDVRRSVVDPSAAAVHLGWQASTPLREGLRRTVDYFR